MIHRIADSVVSVAKGLRARYDHFETTLEEAHYHAAPRSVFDLFKSDKKRLPETTPLQVSTRMIGTSETVGKRFVWGAIFAALSIKTLALASVVLAATGLGILAAEYKRAKRMREDIITETNFAGQQVQGRRADLCRLHKAQVKIMNLGASFKKASMESTTDTIRNIIDSVADERARVIILDKGRYNTLPDMYDFSRPAVHLVNQDERMTDEPASVFKKDTVRLSARFAARRAKITSPSPSSRLRQKAQYRHDGLKR